MPWNEQLMKAVMEQHMQSGVVWIPDMATIVPLSGKAGEGGYGMIRKVHIANIPGIPVFIEFGGKESKAATERKKHEERSIEALVCLVQHPSDLILGYPFYNHGSLHVVVELGISSQLPSQE